MARLKIRQNPDPRGSNRPGNGPQVKPEYCPIHGAYIPVRAWLDLRRRALSGQEPPYRAGALLDAAARLRARCRMCNRQCLTGPQWAEQVRFKIEQGKVVSDGNG